MHAQRIGAGGNAGNDVIAAIIGARADFGFIQINIGANQRFAIRSIIDETAEGRMLAILTKGKWSQASNYE
jgi:hypothetical protein